jgi:hypothetical protein
VPVADAYRDQFEVREAEREERRLDAIRAQLSTGKRKKAWGLADGSLTQREIAKAAGMDEGGASKFFKALRALGAAVTRVAGQAAGGKSCAMRGRGRIAAGATQHVPSG